MNGLAIGGSSGDISGILLVQLHPGEHHERLGFSKFNTSVELNSVVTALPIVSK